MHVQSCCFSYYTYCFVEVPVAVLSLDIHSHHVDAHARWKSKRLLAWFLSHRIVAFGLEKPLLAG